MHKAINNITKIIKKNDILCNQFYLLVDGNDFKPYTYLNNNSNIIEQINHILIEGGDNKYCSIAAASIIAKVERDKYIKELCNCYKKLNEYYNMEKNKGYGTAKHMEGISNIGISPWHRKTYGCCKNAKLNDKDFFL
jgi:ribonuclease HII